MANYNIKPGQSLKFTVVGPSVGKEHTGEYQGKPTKQYIYDIKTDDDPDGTLWATPGLHNELSGMGIGVGEEVVVTRHGSGLSTRWEVAYTPGGRGHSNVPQASSAPQQRSSRTVEELGQLYDNLEHFMSGDKLNMVFLAAAILGAEYPAGGKQEPAAQGGESKQPPHVWVSQFLIKGGVHPTSLAEVATVLLGHDVNEISDVTRDDAAMIFAMSNGGEDTSVVKSALEELEDFPSGGDMPF